MLLIIGSIAKKLHRHTPQHFDKHHVYLSRCGVMTKINRNRHRSAWMNWKGDGGKIRCLNTYGFLGHATKWRSVCNQNSVKYNTCRHGKFENFRESWRLSVPQWKCRRVGVCMCEAAETIRLCGRRNPYIHYRGLLQVLRWSTEYACLLCR